MGIRKLISVIALATAAPAVAGTFSIAPIRVDLEAGQLIEALTVRNESGEQPVVIQAQIFAWSQTDGQDALAETRDLIVTPAVFTVAKQAQQIVRVAVRQKVKTKRELTYRLILKEVPPATETPAFTGLQLALRLSIPVFVAPRTRVSPLLQWHSNWLPDGSLEVTARNEGAAHAQVINFTVQAKDSSATVRSPQFKYVLPGSEVSWRWSPSTNEPSLSALKRSALTLRGVSDQGNISVDLRTDGASSCALRRAAPRRRLWCCALVCSSSARCLPRSRRS
jgi:fimbrial chaperone protein